MSEGAKGGHNGPVGRLRQRADGVWTFTPAARFARAGVGVAVLGRDQEEARRRFDKHCADIARTVEITPIVRHVPIGRVAHPLDRDPEALIARPGPDGWSVLKGPRIIASGLPPYRALDMVREAGGLVERTLEDA